MTNDQLQATDVRVFGSPAALKLAGWRPMPGHA